MKAFDGSIGGHFRLLQPPLLLPAPPTPASPTQTQASIDLSLWGMHQHSPLTTGERSLNISKIYVVNNLRETKKPKLFLNYLMEALKYVSIFPYQIQLFFFFFLWED